MHSIYLAGPLDYADLGYQSNWRTTLIAAIQERMGNASPMTYSPGPHGPFSSPLNDVDALVSINMAALQACSTLVAAVFPEVPSWGTPIEIHEARRQGKRVLLWVPEEDCPPYLRAGTEVYYSLEAIADRLQFIHSKNHDDNYNGTAQDLLYENGGIHYPKISGDVGYDVECMQDTPLPSRAMTKVALGFNGQPLRVKVPSGTWFSMFPRSSMVSRGVLVTQTVCDEGYTGDLFAFAYNTNENALLLEKGTRIGQVVLFNSMVPQLRQVSTLPMTARGANGFGSTGK